MRPCRAANVQASAGQRIQAGIISLTLYQTLSRAWLWAGLRTLSRRRARLGGTGRCGRGTGAPLARRLAGLTRLGRIVILALLGFVLFFFSGVLVLLVGLVAGIA
ncbi:MAG: hypothetical protein L0219_01290, partial [Phycisphaerales bacterium]|nr:hypothetical protein [Phycisphaerales bacterium]